MQNDKSYKLDLPPTAFVQLRCKKNCLGKNPERMKAMKTKIIIKGLEHALLESKKDYIVALWYNEESETWGQGIYYPKNCCPTDNAKALSKAIDGFLYRELPHYISRDRADEIATKAIQNLDSESLEYFKKDADIEFNSYEEYYYSII